MSERRDFRIMLNMQKYFTDYRSTVRLFVNDNVRNIKDLQDRIHHIFKVDKFYLCSQSQYLPPTEDVRILSKDDVVVVVPIDETPKKPRKIKRKRGDKSESSEDSLAIKKRYIKQKQTLFEKTVTQEESCGEESCEEASESDNPEEAAASPEETIKIIPNIPLKPNTEEYLTKKKINIVKIETIKPAGEPSELATTTEKLTEVISTPLPTSTPIVSAETEEETVVGSEAVTDVSEIVKRTRKRVRKRKKRADLPQTVPQTVPKAPAVKMKEVAKPAYHLMFPDDEDASPINLTKEDSKGGPSTPKEPSTLSCFSSNPVVKPLDYSNEERISQYPSMENMVPKEDDVIAFKLMGMSEYGTPELSKYKVGIVRGIDPTTDKILFEIISNKREEQIPEVYYLEPDPQLAFDGCEYFQTIWEHLQYPRLVVD